MAYYVYPKYWVRNNENKTIILILYLYDEAQLVHDSWEVLENGSINFVNKSFSLISL